ncbi:MAG: hypothetical protein HC814_07655, partial [Rhodobacteraceae bacterium]|nr:hypothetical protein [Paracoccaceae bacterium]
MTKVQGTVSVSEDEETQHLTITYSDPTTPANIYTVSSQDKIGTRSAWRQLTDANPQIAKITLGPGTNIQDNAVIHCTRQ